MVDDEHDITTVVSRGLEQRGFRVTIFNNPVEALNHFKPQTFDIILLDIRMPQMTGFELARAIWKTDENAKICFMTSFEIYEQEAAAVFPSLRTPCFLRKPMGLDQLAKHIHTQLGSDSADLTTIN
jgi:two-component system capsular synthesis sensor histidine kinase RcsC